MFSRESLDVDSATARVLENLSSMSGAVLRSRSCTIAIEVGYLRSTRTTIRALRDDHTASSRLYRILRDLRAVLSTRHARSRRAHVSLVLLSLRILSVY